MKKFLVLAASVALLSTSALAGDVKFGGGFGGAGGLTWNGSGAGSWSNTTQGGNAFSGATTEAYGQSEATFQGGYNSGNGNGQPKSGFGGDVYSASGSSSTAVTGSAGNGGATAATGGSGWGAGISFGGAGALKVK